MDDEKSGVSFMLGEISANVRSILAAQASHKEDTQNQFTQVHTRLNSQSDRVTKIEHGYWKVIGIASAIPVVLTVVGLLINYNK